MKVLAGILLLVCCQSLRLAQADDTCSITLPTDFQGNSPIVLYRSSEQDEYALFKPTGEFTNIPSGSQLLLYCTGNKNTITLTDTVSLELSCSAGSFVDKNANVYTLMDLICKSIPFSMLQFTNDRCSSERGYIYEAGFMIENTFYGPTFSVCYDNVTENTFYTQNTINGAGINFNIVESTRRSFTAEAMKLSTTKINTMYTQKNQKARFEEKFGADQNYIVGNNYLARGHLTPDADFIFAYESLTTYFYINVAPEYQPVNAGNWLRAEELARKVAGYYGEDIETYNGYMGIMQLPDKDGNLIDIYLDDAQEIEAPKYYFKVLLRRSNDDGIVFVTHNNMYLDPNVQPEEICTNVCEESGLYHNNFPDTTKGYTYCCRVDEFLTHYDGLPENVMAEKLLLMNTNNGRCEMFS